MGVEEPAAGSSSQHQEPDEDVTMEDYASLDIKMDTIVLPEGVCIFDKPFAIIEKDPDGKKFDKVSRFICRCPTDAIEMMLDINIDVYPLKVGSYLQVMLTTTLSYDGTPMPTTYTHAFHKQQTLMDEFEYVCFGKVFKIKDTPDSKLQVFASFGGLILQFSGDPLCLEKFQMDRRVYLLTRHLKSTDHRSKSKKRTLNVT